MKKVEKKEQYLVYNWDLLNNLRVTRYLLYRHLVAQQWGLNYNGNKWQDWGYYLLIFNMQLCEVWTKDTVKCQLTHVFHQSAVKCLCCLFLPLQWGMCLSILFSIFVSVFAEISHWLSVQIMAHSLRVPHQALACVHHVIIWKYDPLQLSHNFHTTLTLKLLLI